MSKSQNENNLKESNESDSIIESLKVSNSNLQDELDSANAAILDLQVKLEKQMLSKDGRKAEVLRILQERESVSILELASEIGISTKNVSSQLTYLRNDKYKIFTDNNGRKVLMP